MFHNLLILYFFIIDSKLITKLCTNLYINYRTMATPTAKNNPKAPSQPLT